MEQFFTNDDCRLREDFGFDWQFALTDSMDRPAADAAWRAVQLPHDWSTEYPVDEHSPSCGSGGYARTGIGWYRKVFQARLRAGERAELYFEGVYMNCDIWLNDTKIAGHAYGYTSFFADITGPLLPDGNTLYVRVDNARQPNSRWYTGSGITRNVYLSKTQALRTATWGVRITTPVITADRAEVSVQTRVLGGDTVQAARLVSTVIDADGRSGDVRHTTLAQAADATVTQTLVVSNPRRWDIDRPVLYTLRTEIFNGDTLVDTVETRFGIRRIEYTARQGFALNGRKVILQGVCLHHDGGCVGAAVPPEVWRRRLLKLKDMGANAIRCSHNPPDPALLELADELGFCVMDEAFDEWQAMKGKEVGANTHESRGYSEYFGACWRGDMEAMLLRDRNHPSIVMWSIGNEVGEQVLANGDRIARMLTDICHTLDPTRPVTTACDQMKAEPKAAPDAFLQAVDIVGVNYADRWRERTETFFDEEKREHPDWLLLGTEDVAVNGRRGDYRLHTEESVWGPTPYYAKMLKAEKLWKYLRVHPYMIGSFMWTGIDYLGECFWPDKAASAGVMDTCGFCKDGYYFYQSVWRRDVPVLSLCPHRNLDVPVGTVYPVICYTNCFSVELFADGKSCGVKAYEFPLQGMTQRWAHFDRPLAPITTSDLHLSWDVPYAHGELVAVGRDSQGNEIARQTIRRADKPARLQVTIDRDRLPADGRAVCQFTLALLDKEGTVVPDADTAVRVNVAGGTLLGTDNGNPADHTLPASPVRATYGGLAYGVVRAPRQAGEITLTFTADGLEPVVYSLPAVPC
ncbi:MAG TPA: glycoside hydrolase family 2 TIM barrel-domain containing protein [Candidatus Limiplasma sp.]|nr:glycoside hydrolase family 2 TIM barrel-domain containing protein [Candidatus Limiplasma sp.]